MPLSPPNSSQYFQSELNSLKWKRLTTPDGFTYSPELGQDPIIRAYEECVQQNIYCAWRRRVQGEDAGGRLENLPLRSYHPKEFFVFWFTIEEPPLIQKLLDGGLIGGCFAKLLFVVLGAV